MIVIDRFEGIFAVCELSNGDFANIERSLIASNAKEGDIIEWGGESTYTVNENATIARKSHMQKKLNALFDE